VAAEGRVPLLDLAPEQLLEKHLLCFAAMRAASPWLSV
jgi:hypothetical protein